LAGVVFARVVCCGVVCIGVVMNEGVGNVVAGDIKLDVGEKNNLAFLFFAMVFVLMCQSFNIHHLTD
jgi:hypothetical protein